LPVPTRYGENFAARDTANAFCFSNPQTEAGMANQTFQLTQRQLDNDKARSYAEGHRRGRIFALTTILEAADPEIAFEAVQEFMRSAQWKVKAYDAQNAKAKNNGAAIAA
jgi:hypothetical protein